MGDSIVYLHMNSSTVRRHFMENNLKRANIAPWTRFPAIEEADPTDIKYWMRRHPNLSMSVIKRTISLRTSYTGILKQALSNLKNDSTIMVLEDDVSLPANFARRLKKILRVIPSSWDMIRISCLKVDVGISRGYCVATRHRFIFKMNRKDCKKRSCSYCGGAHAIIYKYKAIRRVLSTAPNLLFIDCAITDTKNVNSFCFQMSGVHQNPLSFPSIRKNIPNKRDL